MRNITHKQQHIYVNDRVFAKKLSNVRKHLKSNTDIFFTSADKGNMTVTLCFDKYDYTNKMENMLSDTSTHTIIKKKILLKTKMYTKFY